MSSVFKTKPAGGPERHGREPQRPRSVPKKLYALAALGVLAILAGSAFVSLTRQHGALAVEKPTLVMDTARRGTLLRAVGAQGSFAPERVRAVSATEKGVVNEIFVKPGSVVSAGARIAQMQESGVGRGRGERAIGAAGRAGQPR